MKLEQFHYLLEVQRLRSISAAAHSLHINQTTLSAIIKSIEDEIGFSIFERTPGGVVTTVAGKQLMSLAWEIDLKYEQLMAIKNRVSFGAPAITVLMSHTISDRLALPLLDCFSQFHLPGTLSLDQVSSEDIAGKIRSHEANLGLAFYSQAALASLNREEEGETVSTEILMEDQLHLLVPDKHPLALSRTVSVSQVYTERIASIKSRQSRDMVLGSLHHFCRSVTCFSNLPLFLASIRDQGLVGFIPSFTWDAASCAGCTLIPIKDTERENRLFLCLVTCSGRKLRHQEEVLITCIRDYFHSADRGAEHEN